MSISWWKRSRTAPTGSRSSAISDERIRQETERVFLGQKALKVPALLLHYNKEERKQKTGQNAAKKLVKKCKGEKRAKNL